MEQRSTQPLGGRGRRLAAVWFCDVVDSTKIAAELGDRRFRSLIAGYFGLVRSALRNHGGREIDTAGDGVFAIFDAPADAFRAACGATDAVRELGIEIRSGVHLGEVELDPDGRVGGVAVHFGARVASLARAGEVLTSATTSQVASGAGFRFEGRGTHTLKGIAGRHEIVAVAEVEGQALGSPLEAGEAARRRAATTSRSGVDRSDDRVTSVMGTPRQVRPFVGRVRELNELRLALVEAASGHGSLLLISGEAGIGKSRLMEEVASRAEELGWRVLTGRCWEGGGAPAYWPWIQVIRAAGGEFDRFTRAPEGDGDALGRRPRRSASADPEAERFQVFDEIARFLGSAAGERPCLIVLDDLHAADEPSLLLLRFLAVASAERPWLVLGSYCEDEPRVRELADLFGDLARRGRRIALRGLSADEVALYITLVSGGPPSEIVAARISDITGGNPFFVGEMVRALSGEAGLAAAEGATRLPLPEEVRGLIRRRVAGLSPEAVNTLRVAAVVGRSFDLRVIAPTTTLSRERILDVLDETVRSGVIVEDPSLPGSYTFVHGLVRATLYEDLPPTRRMELHGKVGAVLEDLFREDLDPHLAEIAHHFAQAAPVGGSARGVEYLVRAADRARSVLAYEDAARLYARALQLLETEPAQRHAELLLRLGDVRARAGDEEGARRSFQEAAGIAKRVGETGTLARAALGYVAGSGPARIGLGGLLLTARFEAGARGVVLLEQALDALPHVDSPLRARLLARLATELYPSEFRDRRLALSQEAIDMALRLGDAEALVEALHGRHWATLAPDSVHERLANAQQMLVAATGAGNEEAAFLARHARLHCFLELCDVQGVDTELEGMAQLADRIQQPFYLWHVASLRGMRVLLDGRLADAEREARSALEIVGVRGNETVSYMFEYALLVAIRWAQGRLGEVREQIEEHAERFRGIPRWRDALAAAELGDVRAARAEVERHARGGFALLPRDGLWLLHLSSLAQACVLIGDRRRAAMLYELLVPFADRNAISVSTLPFGPVALRLGMLAALLERWEEAEEQFGRAFERSRSMGARAIEARVLLEHATMLVSSPRGDRDRSAELLTRATAIAEELDLPDIRDRASTLAGGQGKRDKADLHRAVFQREGQYWTVEYEGEVARLQDLKGLRYVAVLLASPGREMHALELTGLLAGVTSERPATAEELGTFPPAKADAILDARAKEAYQLRLAELTEDLEEARSWNDPERVARIEQEIEALTAELGRALGLGGRDRGMPTPAERARVSVTKAIKAAVRAVSRECPRLGEHLEASIRTGRFCSYGPPGQEPPSWHL